MRPSVFENRGFEPCKEWEVDGLACIMYGTWNGTLNGYIRLPLVHPDIVEAELQVMANEPRPFIYPDGVRVGINEPQGYDYIDVPVNGGWTYGPDNEGWIGFDTMHFDDYWSPDLRRQNCPEKYRENLEFMIGLDESLTPFREGFTRWTPEMVENETAQAAKTLAARARRAMADTGGER